MYNLFKFSANSEDPDLGLHCSPTSLLSNIFVPLVPVSGC